MRQFWDELPQEQIDRILNSNSARINVTSKNNAQYLSFAIEKIVLHIANARIGEIIRGAHLGSLAQPAYKYENAGDAPRMNEPSVVGLQCTSAGIFQRNGISIVGPDIAEKKNHIQMLLQLLVSTKQTKVSQLNLEHVSGDHRLDDIRAIQTIHAIGAYGAALLPNNLAILDQKISASM